MGRKPAQWELEEGIALKSYVSNDPNEPKESVIERLTSRDAEFVTIGNVWEDIKNSQSIGYGTEKPEPLLERIIKSSSNEGDLVADFFAGSGTTLAVAEKLSRRWIGCELGKVGIRVTRARLVEQQANPFLIENIGNYQREMIYLTGGRIWEMQHLILKLYGATPRDKTSGLGVRKIDDVDELVYVGYPDRPVTAKKAEELALQAQKLDGTGYKRLVILGWDYEYNYHQALESRRSALKDRLKVHIESRDIPPDIYDYLKKAKSEEDIESFADKVYFYERPYLRLTEPAIQDLGNGRIHIELGIKRYVLMDIPVGHTTGKGQETYTALMKLAKDNFAVLIDYWAVDWDFDGFTFKSQWQAFRGNGKKAKTVPVVATEMLDKKRKRTIAVRVVDIFGNDAGAVLEVHDAKK
jgi:adenine-specific DNA-methyltransferase